MPTLYDNFSQVKQYIDQEKPDLTSYVSKSELEGMSYATTSDLNNYLLSPTISGYEGQMKLYNDGFFEVTSSGGVRAKSFTYNQLNSWSAYTLINRNSLRNYVEGRIAEIESSYATTTYVADYVAEHGGGSGETVSPAFVPYTYNGFTSYISTYTYNATSSPYLDGSLALNKGNGLVLGGLGAAVVGEFTIANGRNAYACADNSVALGNTAHTYGWSSLAIGRNVTTWNYGEVALGLGNFSSSAIYTYTGHGNFNPSNENSAKETVFSIGAGGLSATYFTGWNRIEIRANNDIYTYGVGNYDGRNASDSTTYSLQYILNNTFSYNSTTGELTINTF